MLPFLSKKISIYRTARSGVPTTTSGKGCSRREKLRSFAPFDKIRDASALFVSFSFIVLKRCRKRISRLVLLVQLELGAKGHSPFQVHSCVGKLQTHLPSTMARRLMLQLCFR